MMEFIYQEKAEKNLPFRNNVFDYVTVGFGLKKFF